MNGKAKIIGGMPLKGTVFPIPNKNAIVAALPASILSDKTITHKNVPKSLDVKIILQILKDLGARVDDKNYSKIKINCKNLNSYKVGLLGEKIRASIMFAGPLLTRFGIAQVPIPGGCLLGARAVSTHIDLFQKVDIKIKQKENLITLKAPKKVKSMYNVWAQEASVTATENFAMYAAGTNAKFTLTGAACEPHVASLLELLKSMGAKIEGISSNKITIFGAKKFKKAAFTPDPDFVDIAGFIVAAAVTRGEIKIKNANLPYIQGILDIFSKFNIEINKEKKDLTVKGARKLKIDSLSFPLAAKNLPKLSPRPWPGFPVDILPVMATLACKTKGKLLLQNWMYEAGLEFTKELNALGADIFICDPQRVIIQGPVTFKGGEVMSPGVIQACKALFLAALSDKAETVIYGVDILKRRYPNIFEVYKNLGANILHI